MLKIFLQVVIVGALAIAFAIVLSAAMTSFETKECNSWKKYEAESQGMGLKSKDWQKEQCRSHGIFLAY